MLAVVVDVFVEDVVAVRLAMLWVGSAEEVTDVLGVGGGDAVIELVCVVVNVLLKDSVDEELATGLLVKVAEELGVLLGELVTVIEGV